MTKNLGDNKMNGRKFFTWIVTLCSWLFVVRCSSVDIRREEACPMYGDLHLDFSGKKNVTVEGLNGIVTVPVVETTKAKAIDNEKGLKAFLESYKSICEQEPPYYSEIAYIKRMKAEAESKKEEELKVAEEKKKQKALKNTGLNFDALSVTIDLWLRLRKELEDLETTGQTIKATRKKGEVEEAFKKIEKFFKIGQIISASPDCAFEQTSFRYTSSTPSNRLFRLSCSEKKVLDSHGKDFAFLDIVFEFVAPIDSINSPYGYYSDWPTSAQTNNDIAEIFESSSRFSGSAKIVGGWKSVYSGEPFKIIGIMDPFINDNAIVVKVKIINLHPVN